MSLARLDLGAAPHAAAREALRRVYDRFDEGFDTPDLRDARGLLGLSSAR
jgi:FXSXX-COOH protein